jgi:2-polyprenyl-3-methyl-5-hydroxy-6-metoxy-1,4-benzoquinol methylase
MIWEYSRDPRPDIQAVIRADGLRILDVGCAAGYLGAALKVRGAGFVAGVEASTEAVAEARERLDLVVHGDLRSVPLPFAPAAFDALIFADVLEHVPDPEAVLARYLPLLAPGGRIVLSAPNMRFYSVLLRLLFDRWAYCDSGIRDRTHLRIFTKHSLLAMLRSAGLAVETLRRNFRLFEDQSHSGPIGALATRLVCRYVAPWLGRDLLAYQYVVSARREVSLS